jgi:CRISPR-associated exonuclease Cas4
MDDEKDALPHPQEMARTALRTWSLPEIQILRPYLVPELAVWCDAGDALVAGRADAVSVKDGQIDVVIDWKSDVAVSPSIRADYLRQLREYMSAVQADRGALVFMSRDEVVLIDRPDTSSSPAITELDEA